MINKTTITTTALLAGLAVATTGYADPGAMTTSDQTGDQAGDKAWTVKADVQGSYGKYYGSELRDDTWTAGLFVAADYRDEAGLTLGYNRTKVTYKLGIEDLKQNTYYASGRVHFDGGNLDGRFTARVDGYYIDNDDPTKNTDEGRIIAPQVSYMSNDKNLYVDMGYALSNYSGSLTLHQFTPTVGFGFNEQYDWVQLRGYVIHSSNSVRTDGKDNTYSLEGKWFHYFKPGAMLGLERVQATVLAGKRIFAVDSDAGSVYNLAYLQKSSVSVGAKWNLGGGWGILAIAGYERYEDADIDDDYDNRFGYLDLSKSW